jgi:hypothetical protein
MSLGDRRQEKWWIVTVLAVSFAAMLSVAQRQARAETALEFLQQAPKPHFRPGHTLLPLTRWGWTMPLEVRVELAESWGYALEFGGYATPRGIEKLDDPESDASRLCALAASDPKKYPLCVLVHRPFLDKDFRAALPEEAWCRDAEGNRIEAPRRVLSPEAPDEIFRQAGALAIEPLAKIRENAPIAILLNGGEYGLGVFGFSGEAWQKDPQVARAKGEQSWFDYISRRKAHQELIISEAARRQVPDRMLYVFYPTSGCPHRQRYGTWWHWTWDYQSMKPVSDLPNISVYYKQFNSGWTGQNDMLTQVLNAVGRDVALGEPLSYNWLCAGWTRKDLGEEAFSDPEHYMGFLKCYYTAGMIGGVAGYFAYPPGGFGVDLGPQPPSWLVQMMVLSRAQALFSHLEDLLRGGDLVPGPERHRWSKDQPAYELPTGEADVRVLARRHRQKGQWLLTAWAAGGADRKVSVDLPELGTVELLARPCGTVYRATVEGGKPSLEWLDRDGMLPTAGL